MQHKVPQFIEVEDKIFGPFTLKQFSYLAGGFGLSIIVWRTFADSSFVVFMIAPIVGLSLALTFIKPNGKPFIYLLQNFLFYLVRPKKLFWKNPGVQESKENTETAKVEQLKTERKESKFESKLYSGDQIKKLANALDASDSEKK